MPWSEGRSCKQVGGAAHTTWLREALEASAVTTPILGGVTKVEPVLHLLALDPAAPFHPGAMTHNLA